MIMIILINIYLKMNKNLKICIYITNLNINLMSIAIFEQLCKYLESKNMGDAANDIQKEICQIK